MSKFSDACDAIDEANRRDPRGREIEYSRKMAGWVRKLAPEASEVLLLAARAQHIRRWENPRSEFPEGRTGYLKWRERLKRFHAETLAEIMRNAGYIKEEVEKAGLLLIRKETAADPEGRTIEDAAALTFLEMDFASFAAKTGEEKMIDILRKTWGKMSEQGREEAGKLDLGETEKALLKKALA